MAWQSPETVNVTTGLDNFLPYLNVVSYGWFGRMLIVSIFVIFFMGYLRTKRDDVVGAFAVSSYVTFVISLLFWTIDLVGGLEFGIILGLTAVSSIALFLQKKEF